jgi:FtsP/CotA-like multicopper oxidase with cupredoxin domain
MTGRVGQPRSNDAATRRARARGVIGGVVLATAALLACSDSGGGGGKDPFVEPPVIASENGVLETTIDIAVHDLEVGGTPVTARVYDGDYMPPTLLVQPGDVMKIHLQNLSDTLSNLHDHGMRVSPLGNSDNVFLHVVPGETFDYDVKIPSDHPSGMFYYHPHIYGTTEFQISNGMSGGIIVQGILDGLGDLSTVKQRKLYLKDIQIVDGTVPDPPVSANPTLRTVNGLTGQRITIRPGETQFWEFANIGADIYYDVQLPGYTLYEVERDGNRRTQLIPRDSLYMPTSSRIGVFVQGGTPGEYPLITRAIDMGPQGDQYPEVTLATVVVEGDPEPPLVLPTDIPPVATDLRGVPIAHERRVGFFENPAGDQFYINGRQYDPNKVDTTVKLGTVEEWTVENCSGENHVFHIHQLDFQVVEVNGVAQPFLGRQDTVNLDFRDTSGPVNCPTDADPRGRVKILVPFTEPTNVGKFVYHCHIGEHEDNGMMQVIEVVP